jgi:fibronectin-binding autotransporter adhesin
MTRARDLARIANSNALTIDSSGNVGIGSTVPTSKLSVVGVVSATQVFASGVNLANVASGNITPTSVTIAGEGATAVTINSSGINASGIISATNFYGNGSTLTGISVNRFLSVTSRVGIVSVTAFAGILTVFGRLSNTNVLV